MTTPHEIQALIDEQHERQHELNEELESLSQQIADALVDGKATKALHNKQASVRADMEMIPAIVERLQSRLAEAEADALLAEIRQLASEESALQREYEKLSGELADLQNQVRALTNKTNRARVILQSNQETQTRKKQLLIKQRDDLHSLHDVDALLAQDHEQSESR